MLNDTPKCRSVVFKTKKMISLRLGVFVRDMVPQWRDGSAQQCPGCPEWGKPAMREWKVESKKSGKHYAQAVSKVSEWGK